VEACADGSDTSTTRPSARPTYAQFTRDRVSWDVIVGGLPEFHTVPPRDDNDA